MFAKFLKVLAVVVCFCCVSGNVRAESQADSNNIYYQYDLDRIAQYLNTLRNVSVGFVQIADNAGIQRGQIFISRSANTDAKKPVQGKMRVTYEPPNEDFIVADGNMIQFWDSVMETQSRIIQKDNLLGFILQVPIVFGKAVKVTGLEHIPASGNVKEQLAITLVSAKDEDAGSLTLIFDDNPLKLKQWVVLDAQGVSTKVSLYDMTEPDSLPKHLFVFKAPQGKKKM
ncbi:MAG: outer membrane lipoprotein carrier protein LolA [Alphaproteobacteria bacterium]|nr:outer membrane lipoprotein carrier protein LolA [Alphaproteobacteria bacterium]